MAGPYDSRAIANRILDIAEAKGISLTMMQLLKLVYIAHGWWLTFSEGRPLTSDKAQAWQYGPVHPLLYRSFRKFGRSKISERAKDPLTGFVVSEELPDDVNAILEQVVDSYGRMHAFQLSDMTHQEGTPWDQATKKWGNYAPIPDVAIKEHFDDIRRTRAQS